MKLTVGRLKSLILEALAPPPEQRAVGIVNDTVSAAEEFVDSLVAGSPNDDAAHRLEDLVNQAKSMAGWMRNKNPQTAPKLIRFAQLAQDVAKDTGFWHRPSFLGRDEYLEKMKQKVKRLQNAQVDVLSKKN